MPMSHALLLCIAVFAAGPALAGSAGPIPAGPIPASSIDEIEEAQTAFIKAAAAARSPERDEALERLIAFGSPRALTSLMSEFERTARVLRSARDEAFKTRYVLGSRRRTFENLKLQAERDDSLSSAVNRERQAIADLEQKLAEAERKVEQNEPWRDALGTATRRLFVAIGPQKRKKAEKEIWELVGKDADLEQLLAGIEMLGEVGSPGTALELQRLLAEFCAERTKISRSLPKFEAAMRKEEQRMQKEQEREDGRHSQATAAQYRRVAQEAIAVRRRLTLISFITDAAVEAGGKALQREQGAELEKTMQAFLRALKKARGAARLRTLELLGHAPSDGVRASLRELLAVERDPAAKALLISDLGQLGDVEAVSLLIETFLVDENWHVRSQTARTLAMLRAKSAIPALIERLEAEEGRLRTDLRHALASLTAQDFRTNVHLWQRWWKDNGEDFEVPVAEEVEAASQAAKDAVGVTFFGISTESQRVLFVFDLSRSMNFSMVPRNNPNDEDPENPDMPREGEISRLVAAKRALIQALGGLDDGSVFNIVFYASDVRTWQDRLVTMDAETRAEVVEFVDSLEAVGGTNIFGAMQQALEMAGAKEGGDWTRPEIDTIFLLTDGRASVGETTDPDEILAFVREQNRSSGIVIHTIGLSGAQDAYLLRTLADENGGEYSAR